MIIGISGKIGSGKDTVANMIKILDGAYSGKNTVEKYPIEDAMIQREYMLTNKWEIRRFASTIKKLASLLLGVSPTKLEDREYKETELGKEWWYWNIHGKMIPYEENVELKDHLVKLTPRKIMQLIGTEGGRDLIHPNIWVNAIFSGYSENDHWIIPDVRFPNEASIIKKLGGVLLRVNRENLEKSEHPSELALDYWKNWDFVIENNKGFQELFNQVKQFTQWMKEENYS